jgi:hypothetical protein
VAPGRGEGGRETLRRGAVMDTVKMSEVIRGKRYRTETATLLASDLYWDSHSWERRGRNRFLYRTPNGSYFLVTRTQWQGEHDPDLRPVSREEAMELR